MKRWSRENPMSDDPSDHLPDLQGVALAWGRRYSQAVETRLVGAVEEHLGRVPSDDEVRRYGHCLISYEGVRHYTWNGVLLFSMAPFMEWIKEQ